MASKSPKPKAPRKVRIPPDGKPKLTPAVHRTIVQLVGPKHRLHRKHAADVAGIGERTFHRWMEWGEAEDAREPYRSFARDVNAAIGQVVQRGLRVIRDAAEDGDWKAAAWDLEKRAPKEFGSISRHEVAADLSHKADTPIVQFYLPDNGRGAPKGDGGGDA